MPETQKQDEKEAAQEFKGKTNSWSLSKSFSIEFDEYLPEDADPDIEEEPKKEEEQKEEEKPKEEPKKEEVKKVSYPSAPSGSLYILSATKKWRECEVIEVLEEGKKWKIHYKDFASKYDEIVECTSDRLSLERPENVVPKQKKSQKIERKQSKQAENRIWIQSTADPQIHRECVILEENDKQIKVHFISYDQKYDIWLDKDSPRCQC